MSHVAPAASRSRRSCDRDHGRGSRSVFSLAAFLEATIRLPHAVLYCDLDLCTRTATMVEHWPLPMRAWTDVGRLAYSIDELMD